MKKTYYIFICILTITSCSNNTKTDNTVRTNDFLKGEWLLDSIVGQKEWIQEYLYFTNDNKFWRFSEYAENYLLDENFSWHSDTIYKNNKPIYSITVLDSIHIIIDNGTNKYHCEKRANYDNEDLIEFLQADSVKKIINGIWFIDSAETYPVFIEPNCKNLTRGSKINFNNSGRLEIFPIDTTNNHRCDDNICRVALDHIRYTSGCVMTAYSIEKLNTTELVLKGRFGIALTVKFKRTK